MIIQKKTNFIQFLNRGFKSFLKSTRVKAVEQQETLIHKRNIIIPAYCGDVKKFFFDNPNISITPHPEFVNIILRSASEMVSCEEHEKSEWQLTTDLLDSEIQNKLGQKVYPTVDEYLASIMSWTKFCCQGGGESYDIIDYVKVNNRVVMVRRCFSSGLFSWFCWGLDQFGAWDKDSLIWSPV